MNTIRAIQNINERELQLNLGKESASWHADYAHSPYIHVRGLDYGLTEGDIISIFSQYGEIFECNLVRDKETKKSQGFAFIGYEDQRSTNLAVDNLNGIQLLNRILKVDHVKEYRKPKTPSDQNNNKSGSRRDDNRDGGDRRDYRDRDRRRDEDRHDDIRGYKDGGDRRDYRDRDSQRDDGSYKDNRRDYNRNYDTRR